MRFVVAAVAAVAVLLISEFDAPEKKETSVLAMPVNTVELMRTTKKNKEE